MYPTAPLRVRFDTWLSFKQSTDCLNLLTQIGFLTKAKDSSLPYHLFIDEKEWWFQAFHKGIYVK